MAGAGKKTFTAGETLTASDVNTYLMEQSVMVFGGTAARSSAIPTPSEGMTSYRTDSNQIESYDGSEWRGMSGLQLVKKQTIGSAVSSVTVTGAFSATFDAYKIIVTGGTCGSQAVVTMQLGSTNTGYYEARPNCNYAGVLSANATNNGSSFSIGTFYGTGALVNDEIFNPFLATATQHSSPLLNGGTSRMDQSFGYLNNTTSYTAFTLSFSAAVTGGTIYVYGYGMS